MGTPEHPVSPVRSHYGEVVFFTFILQISALLLTSEGDLWRVTMMNKPTVS